MVLDNINTLFDTLAICKQGFYITESGKRVDLKLSKQQMETCRVFLPEWIDSMGDGADLSHGAVPGKLELSCENIDSYALARKRVAEAGEPIDDENRILVLNLANPVNPGGGVRRGATAQEEDLCRTSTLLPSIDSKEASVYYDYNRAQNTFMGTDGIIITPEVEIFRDTNVKLLEETCVLLVRECANDDEMLLIKVDLEGISLNQGEYKPDEKPTYSNIKKWIKAKYGSNVTNLYISQIKDRVGMKKRKNYNIGSGEGRVPTCPAEKEDAIMDAFKHFNLII